MPLCVYAKEDSNQNFITLDNIFIKSYLRDCTDIQLKVYLQGLYLCANPLSKDNSIEYIKNALEINENDVLDAFLYWQELGLVTIHSQDPLQIQYHSMYNKGHLKTYKKEKYSDFNTQLEQILADRFIINPNDYTKYYDFIENSNIDPNALLAIVQHCVNIKGAGVSHNYILKVAREWIDDGVRSFADVDERIAQRERNAGALRDIAVSIGKTTQISEEDKDLFMKWTTNWGYSIEAIKAAGKKSFKSFAKLDASLDECFKNNAFDALEVEEYMKNKKKLSNCAIQVLESLGLWYDNSAPVVERYISPWSQLGYSFEAIVCVAKYCFNNSIKKLEQLDDFLKKLYSRGIVNDNQVATYFDSLNAQDKEISKIFNIIGLSRMVLQNDRNYFETWTKEWNFPVDVIMLCAKKNVSKPFSEIGKTLAILKEKNLYSLEDATKYFDANKNASASVKKFNESDKKYSQEELSSHFIGEQELDEVEF